ncbi:hypothetical protein BP5796_11367 [Coleophoma crateriformis]|uniref:Major facilitator superfamily (MFS) profile domain-containing protein n=1 Tax=Coleophoma crateriformis TaxID=565419 RepID=A0A3D8QI54_9HELO|nr:hypothetical protein BP5796_11367 [Coleophoma crateriformis]
MSTIDQKQVAADNTIYANKEDSSNTPSVLAGEVSSRFDEAAAYLVEHAAEYGDYTDAEARKVLWKIDLRITVLLWVATILAAVDKIAISNAALYGMKTDTGLVGQQYSWVGSIFYFGYLVAEFPANWLIQKLPVGRFLSCTVIGWAAIVLLLGAAQNAAGLMVLRFIMGALEAPLFPSCSILTVMWYTKKEQPIRVTLWYSGLSSLFTGIVSYGIGHITNAGVATWRLLFFILGAASLLWGIVLFFYLPSSPLEARFLSDRERFIAIDRIKENMTGIENREFKRYQVKEAFLDWKTWPLVIFSICINVPNGGLVTFAAQIVSGLGYGKLETTLLGMPTGVFMTVSGLMVSIPAYYLRNCRCLLAGICCLVPLVCCILIKELPKDSSKGGLLACYYIFYFYWGPYPTVISLPMANVSGHTKKITVNALMFLAYCLGNIIAPQFFISSEAPGYKTGYNAILACISIAIVSLAVYALGLKWENKRRDRVEGTGLDMTAETSLDDLTDKEKRGFRYTY